MNRTLYISPPVLARWLSGDQRSSNVVFLDIEPDFISDDAIRIDLNVIFRPIPVRTGHWQKRDFYIGSTGARITFKAIGGSVKNYTGPMTLEVNTTQTYRRSRKSGVKISPAIKSNENLELNLGDVTYEKDAESTFTIQFSSSERALAPICMPDSIEWEIVLPRGEKAIRDYLIGNLYLYVESEWLVDCKEGQIEIRASDILFFDSERRAISSSKKTLMMLFVLWKQGKTFKGNVKVSFWDEQ